MEKEKVSLAPFLKETLRVLPEILAMEQTIGTLTTILKQWGPENVLPILLGAVRNYGMINTATTLLSLKIDKIVYEFLPNLLISIWDRFGDREAIVCEDKRVTFRQFKEDVFRVANGLTDLRLKSRDAVAIMARNSIEFLEMAIGGWFINITTPFVHWHERGERLFNEINSQKAKVLVIEDRFIDKILPFKDRLRSIEKYIVIGKNVPEGMISFEDFMANSSDKKPKLEFMLLNIVVYTAGTTGSPKGIDAAEMMGRLLDIKSLLTSEEPIGEILKYLIYLVSAIHYFGGSEIKMKTMCIGPYYHPGSFQPLTVPFLIDGIPVVLMPEFDPEEFLRLIEKEKTTFAVGVPTHINRILQLPDDVKRRYDLSSFYCFLSGAAPCAPHLKKGLNELFIQHGGKPVFHEYYGSSEGANHYVILQPKDYIENPKRYESVGKVRCGVVKVLDEEGNVLPPNKEGNIYIRGTGTVLFKGYDPRTTKESFSSKIRIIDGMRFWNEEVKGYLDEDSFMYLTGRNKEVIIPGGVNVYPDEIEKVVLSNPKVADVGIIPIPDKDLGEVVCAAVQLKEGESATEEEIINYCKEKGLYGYKVPRKVDFWRELSRTPDGKMLKKEIISKYWEERGIKRRG